jgi:hypothetical protein
MGLISSSEQAVRLRPRGGIELPDGVKCIPGSRLGRMPCVIRWWVRSARIVHDVVGLSSVVAVTRLPSRASEARKIPLDLGIDAVSRDRPGWLHDPTGPAGPGVVIQRDAITRLDLIMARGSLSARTRWWSRPNRATAALPSACIRRPKVRISAWRAKQSNQRAAETVTYPKHRIGVSPSPSSDGLARMPLGERSGSGGWGSGRLSWPREATPRGHGGQRGRGWRTG